MILISPRKRSSYTLFGLPQECQGKTLPLVIRKLIVLLACADATITVHEPLTREADTSCICWQTSQLCHLDKSAKAKRCLHHCTREANSCYGWALFNVVSGLWDLSLSSLRPHVIIPYNSQHHGIIIYTYLQQNSIHQDVTCSIIPSGEANIKGECNGTVDDGTVHNSTHLYHTHIL